MILMFLRQTLDQFYPYRNANDAIGILNNSASYNKMSVEYKYEMMPNRTWRCRVFCKITA